MLKSCKLTPVFAISPYVIYCKMPTSNDAIEYCHQCYNKTCMCNIKYVVYMLLKLSLPYLFQGPLDVKPSPHSMVHIVEKPHWDLSKEMLVVIPEEDEEEDRQRMGDEPADTDEPTSLRYYNQVVDERPIRPRFPDSSASSASSMDSARTDVTYTGIQTSGSLSAWSPSPHGSSDVCQSQADRALSSQIGGGGGYQPQMHPQALTEDPFEPQAVSSGGYKPQSSWHFDSPTDAGPSGGLAPLLGSPTSVASTQFLLSDKEEHTEEKHQQSSSAASWFTNLLSTTKP